MPALLSIVISAFTATELTRYAFSITKTRRLTTILYNKPLRACFAIFLGAPIAAAGSRKWVALLVAKKVLIVDGTESDLALLRKIVTLARFTVFEANSGVQALKIHRQEHVDLIVMDLQTPGMDGEQVTRTIRAERTRRTVSILLFANRSRPGLRERCLAAGANDFVSKPFKNADLLARFESLMNIGVRKQTALLAHVKAEDAEADVKPFVARIVNVSATGLLLEANESLATGRRVRVKFFVPGSTAQISASATVVRRADAGGTVRWGVRFTALDDSARRIILDYVSV